MNALNKKQMMIAISVSLTAYAFAMSGCGQKEAPNKASKAENLAAVQSLAGTWVSDQQDVKPTQHNLNFITISKTSMKLRALCAIDAKDDKTPAINAVAEVSNDFTVEAKTKNIKFKTAKAFKADASSDCAVSLKDGNIQYSLDGDKLTLGVTAEGTATDSKKAIKDVGMVFKKVTDDEAKTRETDFKAKSAAGVAAAVAKQDPNAPKDGTVVDKATKDAIAKADTTNVALLAGAWLLQEDDQKVKADKDLSKILTKSNTDLIVFKDTPRFTERIVCTYKAATDTDGQNLLSLGFKLNKIENDSDTDLVKSMDSQVKLSGLLFESVLNEQAIKITQSHGGTESSPLPVDFVKLTAAQQDLASCQLTYNANQKISFDLSGDGRFLTLKDDTNGTRKFKKLDADKTKRSTSEKAALDLISSTTGDSKASTADAKAADSETPAATDTPPTAAPAATTTAAPATATATAPAAPAATAPAATTTAPAAPTSTSAPAAPTATQDAAKTPAAAAAAAPAAATTTTPTATTTSTAAPTAKEAAAKMVAMAAAAGQKKDTVPATAAPAQASDNPHDRH